VIIPTCLCLPEGSIYFFSAVSASSYSYPPPCLAASLARMTPNNHHHWHHPDPAFLACLSSGEGGRRPQTVIPYPYPSPGCRKCTLCTLSSSDHSESIVSFRFLAPLLCALRQAPSGLSAAENFQELIPAIPSPPSHTQPSPERPACDACSFKSSHRNLQAISSRISSA